MNWVSPINLWYIKVHLATRRERISWRVGPINMLMTPNCCIHSYLNTLKHIRGGGKKVRIHHIHQLVQEERLIRNITYRRFIWNIDEVDLRPQKIQIWTRFPTSFSLGLSISIELERWHFQNAKYCSHQILPRYRHLLCAWFLFKLPAKPGLFLFLSSSSFNDKYRKIMNANWLLIR